ncbi:putative gustatory receptor 9a [Drosophila subpulchrella]|uniref:putative gustatory receptor 9a n=1 Tax=Drosophila subpulchrella TaxID=1486046 RepID=UPI0018A14FB6|nr:putative gustatory receptor 9a [Drosophila subpulchrella]
MSLCLERCITGYFQLFGLVCGWSGTRLGRLLGSTFLVIILIELANEIVNYLKGALPNGEPLSSYFVKTIQSVNVAYKMVHTWIVLTALFECQRVRRLLEQLPLVRDTSFIYRHFILELVVLGCGLTLILIEYNVGGLYLESLKYAFSLQAVRARYLQMMLMVHRLDGQLEQLHRRVVTRATDYKTLRYEYAHLAKLSRSLSRLYGLSLLQLNILCLGDCIIMCNVYFMVEYLKALPATWFVFAQTMYVVLPTLVKISTMCAACQRCVAKSKHLQEQLNDRPGQTTSDRSQIEGFALQIMQDPIQFDVCGIYHLNLQTLAGMFFFILEALVIFLQFVSLVRP